MAPEDTIDGATKYIFTDWPHQGSLIITYLRCFLKLVLFDRSSKCLGVKDLHRFSNVSHQIKAFAVIIIVWPQGSKKLRVITAQCDRTVVLQLK